ncbi:MAG: AI-2E family transporter [Bacteroidetes bacterium]|nr:AI-2E family transporter [Bacteroidota bacterium]
MSNIRTFTVSGILIFIGIVLICAGAWAFWQVRTIFIYLIVAAILAMITRPLENKLEKIKIGKKKMPRGIRAVVLLLGIYLVIFSFVAIFIPLFVDQAKIISNVDSKQLTTAFHEPIAQVQQAFVSMQQSNGKQETLEQYIQEGAGKILNVTQISSFANSLFSLFGSTMIAFFAISFFTFFFIKDGPAILELLLLLVPTKSLKSVRNIFGESQTMLRKYFTGVLLDVLFVATFVSIGLAIAGVKNAFIIGFFAGIMNIIPYVGPLIGGAFAIVIGVSSNLTLDFYTGLLPLIEKIILVFVAMNLTDAFLVQPYIFSKRVKAHPIEIFLVVLVAGTVAGMGGMIVAVPLYTICRIIAREFLSKYRFVQRLTDELDGTSDQNN